MENKSLSIRTMENKSLSARIRRRNKNFKGEGTHKVFKTDNFGDYRDEIDNHKLIDYELDKARKNKLGFKASHIMFKNGVPVGIDKGSTKCMTKKYADNHQKL